jgi:hypothetical protein
MTWTRVSHRSKCPVCGKPDWCTIGEIGVCCMRVESSRPLKNGGWLHPLTAKPQPPKLRPLPPPSINASKLILEWAQETPAPALAALARALGVSEDSLAALNAVYAKQHRAWAFPMCDGNGNSVGIRLRADDGRKWAVRGSKQGIFIPATDPKSIAYICEGPTDTAAALTLGLFALGRPSCNCGGPDLRVACRRLGVHWVVLVADNDAPGLQGAIRVAKEVGLRHVIWTPPTKDIREFLQAGGTRALIESDLRNLVWMSS